MNSKERFLAAWEGRPQDHAPLTAWCFGVHPPARLRWQRDGQERNWWYSLRMEHIHTLPQPWDLEDDFRRVLAWQALGVDDMLDVSVPWGIDPRVTWFDQLIPAGAVDAHPVIAREYHTPSGSLCHAVRQTGENPGPGWVIQPDRVPLFEDYNIPRGLMHAVSSPQAVPIIRHLYQSPDAAARDWFCERMDHLLPFAAQHGVPVQAWSAFGMDGVVWLAGVQNALNLALDEPRAFGELVEIVAEADYGRTALAVTTPGVDLVIERGWYSSTDFWSPKMFAAYVAPYAAGLARLAHRHGVKFGYVMTTGVEKLGPLLAEAGVDVLYFVDPVQDRITLEKARDRLGGQMTLAGGTNALTLASRDWPRLREEVQKAIEVLGPTRRFILQPVDALFPDTPWEGVEMLIEAWKDAR